VSDIQGVRSISPDDFSAAVTECIRSTWVESGRDDPLPQFHRQDNLFDLGIIDSLAAVDVIEFLEDTYGVTIDVLRIDTESFFSLDGMYACVTGRSATPEKSPAEGQA
jgi:acyl carrier protein